MLATQSNMPSQVFLFQDSELTQPAVDILLPPRKICTIFICLQPNKRRLNQIYSDGNCRDIVGGIRIKAVEAESLGDISSESILNDEKKRIVPTYEETIKFTAVLGKSILSVSPHVIDLGYLTAQSNIPVKGNSVSWSNIGMAYFSLKDTLSYIINLQGCHWSGLFRRQSSSYVIFLCRQN